MATSSMARGRQLTRLISPVFVAVVCLIIAGCRETAPSVAQLQAYVEDKDNGLTKVGQAATGALALQYVPADIMANRELENNPQAYASEEAVDSLYKALRENIYLKLKLTQRGRSLEANAAGAPAQAAAIRSHLMSGIAHDVYLRFASQEEAMPVGHFYAATPLTDSATTVLFVFKRRAGAESDLEVHYQDKRLGFGSQRFKFNASDIAAVPSLRKN